MIIDRIENAGNYTALVKNLKEALEFIKHSGVLPEGVHKFPGGSVNSCSGVSLPVDEKWFETHKRFADVMFILEGQETVSYCPESELLPHEEYSAERDIEMHGGKDILITLPAGYFYIVMPGEGHKPCVHTGSPASFKKYVIKCRQD